MGATWRLTDPESCDCLGVYFIQAREGGLIKIGRSDDPARRLREFQAGCPVDLVLLFAGRCVDFNIDETELHNRFAEYRVRGEWFEPAEPILRCIEELNLKRATLFAA